MTLPPNPPPPRWPWTPRPPTWSTRAVQVARWLWRIDIVRSFGDGVRLPTTQEACHVLGGRARAERAARRVLRRKLADIAREDYREATAITITAEETR